MKKLMIRILKNISRMRFCLYTINVVWIALTVAVIIIIPLYLWGNLSWTLPAQDREWTSHAYDTFEYGSEEYIEWKNSEPMHIGYRIIIQFGSFFTYCYIGTQLFRLQSELLYLLGNKLIAENKKPNVLDKIVSFSIIGITKQIPTLWVKLVDKGIDCAVVMNLRICKEYFQWQRIMSKVF